MIRINKIFKYLLFVVSSVLVLCMGSICFIQFYPFQKSPLLSKMDYPIKTTTQSGKPGDPINVLIIGSGQSITKSFKEAGWKIPDPITDKTSAKIAADSLANLPYPTAPVSSLYLYHRKQDLVFEKPTKTVRIRGHIRLWKTNTTIEHEEVWLGSATYDHGIELSGRSHLPTHHITPSVDKERQQVIQNLKPYLKSAQLVSFDQPNLFGFNGGGDWYFTDGNIAVLSEKPLNKAKFTTRSFALSLKKGLIHFLSH